MDRPIDAAVLRMQLIRRAFLVVLAVLALAAAFLGFRKLITPSVDANRIRTAVVQQGPIEATISASGTVVPEFEEVVSSPINSRVLEVLLQPGQSVSRGQPLLILDTSETRLELESLDEQIALKENERETQNLDLRKSLISLESRHELKQVDLESHRARHERFRRLFQDGLTARSELDEVELDIRRAEIELRQMVESMENLRRTAGAEIERLELEKNILLKQRQDALRLLDLATAKAPRDGVLTWVVEDEGTTIDRGGVLARIADLESFRVDATVSDVYSPRLAAGLPARVELDRDYLNGTLKTVLPTIQDGSVTLIVELEEPSHANLRSNLRVDVFIITDSRADALKVRKGPFANGTGPQDAFVVRGDQAQRTRIEVGMSSFDDVEIVSGVAAGEEIVISDMTGYMHMKQVPIR